MILRSILLLISISLLTGAIENRFDPLKPELCDMSLKLIHKGPGLRLDKSNKKKIKSLSKYLADNPANYSKVKIITYTNKDLSEDANKMSMNITVDMVISGVDKDKVDPLVGLLKNDKKVSAYTSIEIFDVVNKKDLKSCIENLPR